VKAIVDLVQNHPDIRIQIGYQFLFASAVREMLSLWKSGKLGKPVHV